jgi:hypothetical protein
MTLSTYTTGTVGVANGGTTVTGVGTVWSGVNVVEGDYFARADGCAVVTGVTDTTHITITPWPGATVASGGAYTIHKNYSGRIIGVAAAATIGDFLAAISTFATLANDQTLAGKQVFGNTTEATGVGTTAAALFAGGVEIAKKLFVTGAASLAGTLAVSGAVTLSAALTYGGVTLANAVTGTGNMVLSVSPALTGTASLASATLSGNLSLSSASVIFFNSQTSNGPLITMGYGNTKLIIQGGTAGFQFNNQANSAVLGTLDNSGNLSLPATTASTSTTTGALTVAGGMGIIGAVYIGGTANVSALSAISSQPGFIVADFRNTNAASGDYGARMSVGSATAGTYFLFYDGNLVTTQGSITHGSGTTAYNTSSDIRGKPNREALSLDLARATIDRLKIWDFDKSGNAIRGIGVIAQEAIEVHHSFARKGNTEDEWWTAEKAAVVPFIIANMQQANARLDAIERCLNS